LLVWTGVLLELGLADVYFWVGTDIVTFMKTVVYWAFAGLVDIG
jgi:hypothetical protein